MKIPEIAAGEVIDKPGVYDIPMSWYHDDCCEGPSVSSSVLRTLDTYSPVHAWDKSALNPDRADTSDDEEKKHFRIGRAAHWLLLEPTVFSERIVTRPDVWDSWMKGDAKKWRAARQAEGKTVLDPKEYDQVAGVAAAFRAHPIYKDGLLSGAIEKSIVWKDSKTGIWLKARPDEIPEAANMLTDIKCVADARPQAAYRAVRDFAYDMQLALGGIGIQRVLGRTIETYALAFCEVKRPHGILLAPIDSERIKWARVRLRAALDLFATCYRQKDWPSYARFDGQHVMLADYERQRMEEAQKAGELPKEF